MPRGSRSCVFKWLPTAITITAYLWLASQPCHAAKDSSSSTSSSSASSGGGGVKSLPRRERHLDFMDAPTLAYYLGVELNAKGKPTTAVPPTPSDYNHNVAVMFYAQRDTNSHYLARAWDAIGQILKAGTRKSNLIMGLFDCELDQQHFDLCDVAGITHYPSLLYMSPNRKFPHAPVTLPKHKKPLPHTTLFQGNWQYEKSILDWLRTMQTMSGWTAFWNKGLKGWWKAANAKLQSGETANNLPVGVPILGGTGGSGGASSATAAATAAEVAKLKEEKQIYEDLIVRSSTMLDATLFPVANPLDASSTDVFAYLNATNGWDDKNKAARAQVVRSCAMEVVLDYCSRLTTHKTDEFVALKKQQQNDTAKQQTLAELEAELRVLINDAEPYCEGVDACVLDGFQKESCRPPTCPFTSDIPCRYLSSCFEESIQKDYATALGLSLDEDAAAAPDKKKKRGWF